MTSRGTEGRGTTDRAVAVTGIVLAGGRSRRFGEDKLAALVDGRPLLERAIAAVAAVVDEVVVVVGAEGAEPRVDMAIARGAPVVVVRDAAPDRGPLAGLAAGLAVAHGRVAIVVGGDQPSLVPGVLAALVRRLAGPAEEAAEVAGAAGARGPLDVAVLEAEPPFRSIPAAVRVATVRPAADAALAEGTRSLIGCYEALRLGTLPAPEWRALDPGGASLRDVDRPEDLASA